MSDTVDFLGETFNVADKVSSLAFMRFAKVAKAGVDSNDMDGMVAMYDLLRQVISDKDWPKFEEHADRRRADGDQLLAVVKDAFAILAGRPTGRLSDSSGGPLIIEPSSTVDSSSLEAERVIRRLNEKGRPDLALIVRNRHEAQTA